jgi:hypothetical protein
VKHVVISSILENTFCATLILEQAIDSSKEEWHGRRNEVRIDARPSDCFVLALKNKVDIFVTHEVFEQVQDVSKMTEEVENSLAQGGALPQPGLGEIEFDLGQGGEGESVATPEDFLESDEVEGTEEDDASEDSEADEGESGDEDGDSGNAGKKKKG